jgi:hypothetical protein
MAPPLWRVVSGEGDPWNLRFSSWGGGCPPSAADARVSSRVNSRCPPLRWVRAGDESVFIIDGVTALARESPRMIPANAPTVPPRTIARRVSPRLGPPSQSMASRAPWRRPM